ncbi:MAG: hypothetical protein ACRDA3_05340 [Peptostreptococcaceae bacterium]
MRIIANEIKKIFNITNIFVVIVASFLIWNLFINYGIEHFPNGQPNTEHYNDSVIMLNKYGTSMDEKEFEDYKKIREEKYKEATNYLLNNKEAISLGIKSYDEFIEMMSNENSEEIEKRIDNLHKKIVFEENVPSFWYLQAMDYEIMRYEDKEFLAGLNPENITQKQLERQNEIINSEQVNSPLNFEILSNYNDLILDMTVPILISVAIMISPIFSSDNRNKVNYIQYSTKTGRKLFNKKIISGLISTALIVTIQLGIFFAIYKSNNTLMFWDCSINSVFSDVLSWFDLTFGQYIILSVVIIYIVALVYSAIAMFVSTKVTNYIALIGIQIPILFSLNQILSDLMDVMVLGTSIHVPKYTLPIGLLMSVALGVVLVIISYKKEKILDLNN